MGLLLLLLLLSSKIMEIMRAVEDLKKGHSRAPRFQPSPGPTGLRKFRIKSKMAGPCRFLTAFFCKIGFFVD